MNNFSSPFEKILRLFGRSYQKGQSFLAIFEQKAWAIAHAFWSILGQFSHIPEKILKYLEGAVQKGQSFLAIFEQKPWAIAHAFWSRFWPKMNNFSSPFDKNTEIFGRSFQNQSFLAIFEQKPWAIAHAFCSKMAKNEQFFIPEKKLGFWKEVWKGPKIHQNHGLKPTPFAQKWTIFHPWEKTQILEGGVKRAQNPSKPWAIAHAFCSKNGQKPTVFESLINYSYFSRRCENDPKSIKTMGYSPWLFAQEMAKIELFLKAW